MNSKIFFTLLLTPYFFAMQPEDKNFSLGRFADHMQAQEQRIVTEYEFDAPGLHPSAQKFFKDRFAEQEAEIAHLKKIQIEQEEALERWKAAYDEKNKMLHKQKLDQAAQCQRQEELNKVQLLINDQKLNNIIANRDEIIKQKNKDLEVWYNKACDAKQALNTFQESKDDRLLQLRKEFGKPAFEGEFVALKFETEHEDAMQNPETKNMQILEKRLETPALKETLELIAKSGNPELIRVAIAHCVYASMQAIHFPFWERKQQLESEKNKHIEKLKKTLKEIVNDANSDASYFKTAPGEGTVKFLGGHVPIVGPMLLANNTDIKDSAYARFNFILEKCVNALNS